MLYEKYERRVRTVFKFRKQIFRFRKLIYAITAVIALLSTAFVSTKGIVTNTDIPKTLDYGESYSFNSKALFSNTSYEYRLVGETQWQTTKPQMVGSYEVRIITDGGFGSRHTIKRFDIIPQPLTIDVINSDLEFGTDIRIGTVLSYDDQIESFTFKFDDLSLTSTEVEINDVVIVNKEGVNVTSNYRITNNKFNITFIPKRIKITLVDLSKTYDGMAHTSAEITVGPNQLLSGHRIELTSSGQRMDVGTVVNDFNEIRIFDENNIDVTDNYQIEKILGQIEVLKRPITIKTASDQMIYDGSVLNNSNYEISVGSLVEGHTIVVNISKNIINVGAMFNEVDDYIIYDADLNDVTKNYDVGFDYGTLEVLPKPMTIKTESHSKIYDGSILIEETYDIIDGDILDNHHIEVIKHTEISNVSIVDNILEINIYRGDINLTSNYDITYVYGQLEVLTRKITVKTATDSSVYDDFPFMNDSHELILGVLIEGHTTKVEKHTEITNVSIVENVLVITIFDEDVDVTDNYLVEYEYGTLEIAPLPIHIKPAYADKTYDGSPLEQNDYVLTNNTYIIEGHILSMISTGTSGQSNVGIYINEIQTISITSNSIDVTYNYELIYETEQLEIQQKNIDIRPIYDEKIYDGDDFNSDGYELLESTTLVDGHRIIMTTSGTSNETYIGTYINEILSIIIMFDDMDVTANYNYILHTNNLVIHTRSITIKPLDGTKVYDGTDFNIDRIELLDETTLVMGHVIKVVTTGTDGETFIGNYINTILDVTIFEDGIDVTNNYLIERKIGDLEITIRYVLIKPTNDCKVYDGFDFNNDTPFVLEGSVVGWQELTITTTGTNGEPFVGVYENAIITSMIMDGTLDVTGNYKIDYEDGLLEITIRHITIETLSREIIYNGEPMFEKTLIYDPLDFASNQQYVYGSFVELTNVGQIENKILITIEDSNGYDVTTNYDIAYIYGQLVVLPRPITVKPDDDTKEYDDLEFNNQVAIVSGTYGLVTWHDIEITTTGTNGMTDVGTYTNEIKTITITEDGVDITYNYDITRNSGELVITKRYIEIESLTDDKIYDDKPLNGGNFTVLQGSFVSWHTHEITIFGSIIDVGIIENYIEIEIYNADGKNVTYNYDVDYMYGEIEIFERPITVKPEDDTKTYDDLAFNNSIPLVIGEDELIDGHVIIIETSGTDGKTDVGDYPNYVTSITIYSSDNRDVTSNYQPTLLFGILTITQRDISIKSLDAFKIYDGTPLFEKRFEVLDGSFVDWHTYEIAEYVSITDKGIIPNYFEIEIYDEQGKTVTDNYNIDYGYGTLTVDPRQITIKTDSNEKIYDGNELYEHNHEVILGTLVDGHKTSIVKDTRIINAGDTINILDIAILDALDNDVTNNYEVIYEEGTLKIKQRYIRVETLSKIEIYNGEALIETNLLYDPSDLVEHHYLKLDFIAQITNVGQIINKITIIIRDINGIDVTENYDFDYDYGTLTMLPRLIMVKPNYDEKFYDGQPFNSDGYKLLEDTTLVLGQVIKDFTTSGTAGATNVGLYTNKIEDIKVFDGETDVTINYEIIRVDGELLISPRPITVKPEDDSKTYDDLEFNNQKAIILGEYGLVAWHDIEIITTGTNGMTDVGTYKNEIISLTITEDGIDVTANYEITFEFGELIITKRYVQIETHSEIKVYDGTALIEKGFDVLEGSFVVWHTTEVTLFASITDVDLVGNYIEIEIYNTDGKNVTYNYDIDYKYGSLEITPRPITIETGTKMKVYDGEALYLLDFEIVSGTLVEGHETFITSYPSIINVDLIENLLEIDILDDTRYVTFNYKITYEYGELEITQRPITVLSDTKTKVYDGLILHAPDHIITVGSLVDGHTTFPTYYKEITDAALVENTIEIDIYDALDDIVTFNYEITYVFGTLEVKPRPISIETASDSKVYDGKALYAHDIYVTLGSLVVEHVFDIINDTKITNVGSIDNVLEFRILEDGRDITFNYDINLEEGKLTVSPRYIVIKPKDSKAIYNNEGFRILEVEFLEDTSLVEGHEIEILTSVSGTDVGIYPLEVLEITITDNGVDVTSNYVYGYEVGQIEILSRKVTIRAEDAIKAYDGLPLVSTEHIVRVGTLADGHYSVLVTTGSQTNIGYSMNEISQVYIYDENGNDKTANYDLILEDGVLEVTPGYIEISTPSATKDFDNTPLTVNEWQLTSGTLIDHHSYDIEVIGTITYPGKAYNYFTIVILDQYLNDVSDNYVIKQNIGILEVIETRHEIVIKSGSDAKEYDGSPLIKDEWMFIDSELLPGHSIEVIVTGIILEPGMEENAFEVIIYNEFGADVTLIDYVIDYVFGRLIIFDEDLNGDNNAETTGVDSIGKDDASPDAPIFRVHSEVTETLYLREKSFGNYNTQGFNAPIIFDGELFNPLQMPSAALEDRETYLMKFEALTFGLSYYMPYYAIDGFGSNTNDVFVNSRYGLGYEINYKSYNRFLLGEYNHEHTSYKEWEALYKEFVLDNYLELPETTKSGMLRIAAMNGLDVNSPTLITDIQNYILGAAIYNMQFKPYPSNVDKAVYFLEHLYEGICQHFAMAATVMYRAMGIPARYTIGYVVDAEADEWVEVGIDRYHAWVEIYIEGFGWIPIEVTPGGVDGSGSGSGRGSRSGNTPGVGSGDGDIPGDGEGGGPGGENPWEAGDETPLIVIYTGNASKHYDGQPLTKDTYYYTGDLKPGHILNIDVVGTITQVGQVDNLIEVSILDSNGEDVSSEYDIRKITGLLVVVPNNGKPIIEFSIFDIGNIYTGTIHTHQSGDYWIPTDNLPDGYRVSFDIMGETIDVGFTRTYIKQGSIRIYDASNIDVTTQYNVVTYYGSITVMNRQITIMTETKEKYDDGTPLSSDVYYITQGSLAAGHTIEVIMTAVNEEVGEITNKIDSIIIKDQFGNVVTKNYQINTILGTLKIIEE